MATDYKKLLENPLWPTLVETVHALVMYRGHKRYVANVLLQERRDITPEELSRELGIPLGEALVILYEIKAEKGEPTEARGTRSTPQG